MLDSGTNTLYFAEKLLYKWYEKYPTQAMIEKRGYKNLNEYRQKETLVEDIKKDSEFLENKNQKNIKKKAKGNRIKIPKKEWIKTPKKKINRNKNNKIKNDENILESNTQYMDISSKQIQSNDYNNLNEDKKETEETLKDRSTIKNNKIDEDMRSKWGHVVKEYKEKFENSNDTSKNNFRYRKKKRK